MGFIGDQIDSLKSLKVRQALEQVITLGMIVSSALIIWKFLMCVTGSESPVVVVLSESMEPAFQRVHERNDTKDIDVLTKGDNNDQDDRVLYAPGQQWLQHQHIMGRAVGFLPYVGYVTIIMTENPIIKYALIGALGLLAITSKD
ncbi:signal peptidase complex catalytic subunit SEC11C isoform X3 [Helianthus annuus]|uniref:signal peptidase complex catalytic subunit SEC11C isoform X3 n=1 Tax=Helianthus annuus TaxID=4232 RepID=UPI001652BC35|nr:signal peptidase complex catalytic subunit SEC11C isoform X3 [Helianthus annuus]